MKSVLFVLSAVVTSIAAKAQYSNEISVEKLLKTDTTETGQHKQYPGISNEEVTI